MGIDIGSLYVGLVLIDGDGKILQKEYLRHHGEPAKHLGNALNNFPLQQIEALVRTGSGGEQVNVGGIYITDIVAQIEGVRSLYHDARNIIYIGGGSFSLTRLDESGNYNKCTTNTACASGTGAFLDQQAMRLQVPPAELSHKAMAYKEKAPGVATRCAVFAKSDMIHLQQEGYSTDAIAAGLCAGLGNSTVDGLLGGHSLSGKTVCIGGVARNSVVIRSVREKIGCEVIVPEEPELVSALGAAQYAAMNHLHHELCLTDTVPGNQKCNLEEKDYLRPPLELKLSNYPVCGYYSYYLDKNDSEVAMIEECSGEISVYLGIDIGSTSTKAALFDFQDKVVAWIYRKTAGNPIDAVQKVLSAISALEQKFKLKFHIKGVGTTGSGRKMIKEVIGADLAINEITAHARAAVFLDPEVDTILELGGQDAKFTQLQNGVVYNSIMNYVCAAGTGSFIEEQALKLGIPIEEYADFAMGQECPKTSDRCTVYMERDLDLLLAKGWSKPAVAASVLHSVRDNYLNKVVGGLYIGNHVCFQGATARNRALVAAFEVELGVPIRVSPYCHMTGALGMCLLLKERFSGTTNFKGLAFAEQKIKVTYETCELCHNLCNLSIINTGEATVAWGLKCGREYESKKPVVQKNPGYEYLRQREVAWRQGLTRATQGPVVGLPRSLGTYGYLPLWKTFFQKLGCQTILSGKNSEKVLHEGTSVSTAEYCAPVTVSHGQVKLLLEEEKIDFIFVPYLLRETNQHNFTDTHFCCYLQAHPGVLASVKGLEFGSKLIAPIVQFNLGEQYAVEQLVLAIGDKLKVSKQEIAVAYQAGLKSQNDFAEEALRLGREGLENIKKSGELGIVLVGRPYNTLDPGMTLDLPRKIAQLGYTVLFLDMLPLDYRKVKQEHPNMYWLYGQKILAAADFILQHDKLFGVYFTNFMCGPDSYIQSFFKEMMANRQKPYISLQFDGHGADAGYLTRIEAALESFHAWNGNSTTQVSAKAESEQDAVGTEVSV